MAQKDLLALMPDATNYSQETGMAQLLGMMQTVLRGQDDTNRKVNDVHDRVIRIEAQDVRAEVVSWRAAQETLSARIAALEAQSLMARGAGRAATIAKDWAPVIVALVAVMFAYLKHPG